jgi:sulfatase modifying factor 1
MKRSRSAGASVVLLVASAAACFPDYSGLSDGPARDASQRDVGGGGTGGGAGTAGSDASDAALDAPRDDLGDRSLGEDGPVADAFDASVPDVHDATDATDVHDATIDPCRRPGGRGGIYVAAADGDFCIDATEVTNGAYLAFTLARPNWGPADQPAYCGWNTSLKPFDPMWPRPGEDRFPVAVDWCDAWSYCQWAGKRLCGQIGGGPVAEQFATEPDRSKWYRACAGSGRSLYPYGDAYDPKRCNGVEYAQPQVREVGAVKSCEGRPPGLFDMSGNLYEWIDACSGTLGADDSCRMMGGGFSSPDYELACSYRALNPRSHLVPNIGFRCCSDLTGDR